MKLKQANATPLPEKVDEEPPEVVEDLSDKDNDKTSCCGKLNNFLASLDSGVSLISLNFDESKILIDKTGT